MTEGTNEKREVKYRANCTGNQGESEEGLKQMHKQLWKRCLSLWGSGVSSGSGTVAMVSATSILGRPYRLGMLQTAGV
jgi:hypothetical protein